MVKPRFIQAKRISLLILNAFGFAAIVSPWRTVYVLPECLNDQDLRRHETAHLAQMERDGWFVFWFFNVLWYFVPGYDKSPYEIEARQVERDPNHPLLRGYDC